MTLEATVADHYAVGQILQKILRAVRSNAGATIELKPEDLAPVDEFHIGGRAATIHLVDQLGLKPGQLVLDVGSGIGGTARYLASQHGCLVTGIDITPEYCGVATSLAREVGLHRMIDYRLGCATELPFDDSSFSGAVTLHVGMNIPDKAAVYREVARVLEPGAPFGIYDVLAGPKVHDHAYPVPWASSSSTSFLADLDDMRQMLEGAGFRIEAIEDRRDFALEFFKALRKSAKKGPPPLGLHLLMGEGFAVKIGNMIENIKKGRSCPYEIICRRP